MARTMLWPKAIRLLRRADFRRVQGEGRRIHGRYLVTLHTSASGTSRYGITVSRKVGNAVVRNRVKRWIRESIRCADRPTGVEVVFIARRSAADAGLLAIRADIESSLAQIRSRS